jgi:hypothetical protein
MDAILTQPQTRREEKGQYVKLQPHVNKAMVLKFTQRDKRTPKPTERFQSPKPEFPPQYTKAGPILTEVALELRGSKTSDDILA